MKQRAVGATGLTVSRLGLGTMTWGRDTDEHEARDQLIAFAEAGGTLVDTAHGYGDGASEELVGRLIGDVVARDEIVLATKAGISRRTGEREAYAEVLRRVTGEPGAGGGASPAGAGDAAGTGGIDGTCARPAPGAGAAGAGPAATAGTGPAGSPGTGTGAAGERP